MAHLLVRVRLAHGYGGTFVSPALDPRRSAEMTDDQVQEALDRPKAVEEPVSLGFQAFDSGLKAFYPPGADNSPTPLIFVPDLRRDLWYRSVDLAGGDPSARDEAMPTGLFEPAGCR